MEPEQSACPPAGSPITGQAGDGVMSHPTTLVKEGSQLSLEAALSSVGGLRQTSACRDATWDSEFWTYIRQGKPEEGRPRDVHDIYTLLKLTKTSASTEACSRSIVGEQLATRTSG